MTRFGVGVVGWMDVVMAGGGSIAGGHGQGHRGHGGHAASHIVVSTASRGKNCGTDDLWSCSVPFGFLSAVERL